MIPSLFNLHTHTCFSDGSDAPVEYAREAVRQGFTLLGFSDHSPMHFKNTFALKEENVAHYFEAVSSLRQDPEFLTLEILCGVEFDFIPGSSSINVYRNQYAFDFFIGSVHLIKYGTSDDLWFIDGPESAVYDKGLRDIFGGDIKAAVTAYYHQVNAMILSEKPDIIGHLDKIKMYNKNRYFSETEEWYVKLVDETLEIIRSSDSVVEVNTRGLYKKRADSLFPGIAILEKLVHRGIPVTLSSDAHKPYELSLLFPETLFLLKELGFPTIQMKTKKGWQEILLV